MVAHCVQRTMNVQPTQQLSPSIPSWFLQRTLLNHSCKAHKPFALASAGSLTQTFCSAKRQRLMDKLSEEALLHWASKTTTTLDLDPTPTLYSTYQTLYNRNWWRGSIGWRVKGGVLMPPGRCGWMIIGTWVNALMLPAKFIDASTGVLLRSSLLNQSYKSARSPSPETLSSMCWQMPSLSLMQGNIRAIQKIWPANPTRRKASKAPGMRPKLGGQLQNRRKCAHVYCIYVCVHI